MSLFRGLLSTKSCWIPIFLYLLADQVKNRVGIFFFSKNYIRQWYTSRYHFLLSNCPKEQCFHVILDSSLAGHPYLVGKWQTTFSWLGFDLSLQTLVICEISHDCHTEWSHRISLCNQAPGRFCQTECWLGRGVLEPDFCSSQALNMTLMESKGQDNPDQDLHTILVWGGKRKYAQWKKNTVAIKELFNI